MLSAAVALAVAFAAPEPAAAPPTNIARGKPYVLSPAPNYAYCTDRDDRVQLTDGQSTRGHFWTQKGTVGWQNRSFITITVDLGAIMPLAGAAMTTAAGKAGVVWPASVRLLTSDDRKTWFDAGDLVAAEQQARGPLGDDYAIRKLSIGGLATRGRYVQFVILPRGGSAYSFADEIEVYRGPDELVKQPPRGKPVANAESFWRQARTESGVRHRWRKDAAALVAAIEQSTVAPPARGQLLPAAKALVAAAEEAAVPADDGFRAVLPIGDVGRQISATQAAWWRAMKQPPLAAWCPPPFDPEPLVGLPTVRGTAIAIDALRGETRAAVVSLANSTSRTEQVLVRFEGLADGPAPDWIEAFQVPWTDSSQGEPVQAALVPLRRSARGWTIAVEPGLVAQCWLAVRPQKGEGEQVGTVVLEAEGAARLTLPFSLRVWPLDFPQQPTLITAGWCYTDRKTARGVTEANRAALVEHLRSRLVNVPWAGGSTMLRVKFSGDEPLLDTAAMDEWLALWPAARQYRVFLAVGKSFAGTTAGTAAFDRSVGAWIKAWVKHLGQKGLRPEQLALLIHDEPREGTDAAPIVAWAKAIRAAEPKVVLWNDPTYRTPAEAPAELFAAHDVLCPNRPMWLAGGEAFERFYLDQQRQGRTLEFYSCSGPARALDPYSYFRLQAWHCWKIGAVGSSFWAFSDNSGVSSWNEYLAAGGPFCPLFLDETGVTAGKQMEAIREGAQDYETLVMLAAAIERARAAGRTDAAAAARRVLDSAVQRVLGPPEVASIYWRDAKDRTVADAVRAQILQAIVSLAK